jgi:hypothetical protein
MFEGFPLTLNFLLEDTPAPYQDENFCKSLLLALLEDTMHPSKVAHYLDEWVTSQAKQKLKQLIACPELIQRWGETDSSRPQARPYIQRFFDEFPELCATFPPHSNGQDRLIEFIKALK